MVCRGAVAVDAVLVVVDCALEALEGGNAAVVGTDAVLVEDMVEIALADKGSAITAAMGTGSSCTATAGAAVEVVETDFLIRVDFTSLAGRPSAGAFSSAIAVDDTD